MNADDNTTTPYMMYSTELAEDTQRVQANTACRNLTAIYFLFYIAIKVAFIFSGYDLFTEEAQYWLWSRHPDWSYYSKPPMIAWVNYLTGFIGQHDSIIRLTALAFGLASLYGIYKVTLSLFQREHTACIAAIILSVMPYFVLSSTFLTTDSLLIFFWIITGYFFIKSVRHNRMQDWLLTGVFFGLGCLSKYTMAFFVFSLTPLLYHKRFGNYFKGILGFTLAGIVLMTPVVIWNYNQDWITVRHVFSLAGGETKNVSIGDSLRFLSEFAGGVVAVNSPFLLYMLLRKDSRKVFRSIAGTRDQRILMWLLIAPVGTIAVFFVISIFKRTEVNWPAMSYTSIPVVLACVADRARSQRLTLWLSAATFVSVLLLLFPRTLDRFGWSNVVPPQVDGMKRMAGWKDLSAKISSVQRQYPVPLLVITDDYHVASEIAFYTATENVYCINNGRRMNQFDIWGGPGKAGRAEYRALYVTTLPHPPKETMVFRSIEAQWTFPVIYRGSVIRSYNIFILNDYIPEDHNGFYGY